MANNFTFTDKKRDLIYDYNTFKKLESIEKLKVNYHKQRLSQSRWAFWLSFFGSICGFFIIGYTIICNSGNNEWPGIISGIVIEAVSALFYELSNKANEKITEFFSELTREANSNEAINLCDKIKSDEIRDNLLVKLSLFLSGYEE